MLIKSLTTATLTLASAAMLTFALGCEQKPAPPVTSASPTSTAPTITTPATTPVTVATDVKVKPYPLDTCIVSGEKLSSMGEAIRIVHNGQEIKFCCEDCVASFKKNPDKYLSKLNTPASP